MCAFPHDPDYAFSADHALPVIPGDFKDLPDASQVSTHETPSVSSDADSQESTS